MGCQQISRLLAASTRKQRVEAVRRFTRFVGSYPRQWTPAGVEEWTA